MRAVSEIPSSATTSSASRAVGGEDTFKKPSAALAKFLASPESVVSNINLTVRGAFASWGRASSNPLIYPIGKEDRVPKCAFKLVLWKPGLVLGDNPLAHPVDDGIGSGGLNFWISTKATLGIKGNDVVVPSVDPKAPEGPLRNWGILKS
jgi:hypothetical protein